MTTPKILPAALALLFSGLLVVASCHHVDPRTAVLGPVSCELKHGDRVTKCTACIKSSCCNELLACANDAPCPCGLSSRLNLMSPDQRLEVCGQMNAPYAPLASCLDTKCAAECPAEDALHKHPLVGKLAPEVLAEPVGGVGPKTLAEARGKVVVLEFWATWCGACKRSFPKYQEMLDRFPRDLAVLAISVDDPEHVGKDKLLAFAKDAGVKFSILWDTHLRMDAMYARPSGLPTAFLIDRAGTVRSVHTVYDARMRAEIEALVKSSAPPPDPHQGG